MLLPLAYDCALFGRQDSNSRQSHDLCRPVALRDLFQTAPTHGLGGETLDINAGKAVQ